MLSITNINQPLSPKILRPGRSGGGEQSSSAFVRAPVTVRSAICGNVEESGGGTRGWEEGRAGREEEGQKRRGVHQPSLKSVERVCALCVSTCPIGMPPPLCFIPTLWYRVVWRSDHT